MISENILYILSIDYIAWQRAYFSTDGIKVIDVT